MVSTLFKPELGEQITITGAVDKYSAQNRRHDDKGGSGGQQSAVRQLQRVAQIRQQIIFRTQSDSCQQGDENQHTHGVAGKQILPVLILVIIGIGAGVTVKPAFSLRWQQLQHQLVKGLGCHDAEGCGKGSDYGYRYDNRI